MIYILLTAILLISLNHATFTEHVHLLNPTDQLLWDYSLWTFGQQANPSIILANTCTDNILGQIIQNSDSLNLSINDLPVPHTQLKIEFTLYLIDGQDAQDSVEVLVDGVSAGKVKMDDIVPDQNIVSCGESDLDYKKDIGFIIEHSTQNLEIKFEPDFFENITYFGVNNVKISYIPGCEDNSLIPFNDDCWTSEGVQMCYNFLSQLDHRGTNNQSIDNKCNAVQVNGQYIYEFEIQFNAPYVHNTTCVTQEVEFQGEPLDEGYAWPNFNEWQYYPNNQTIQLRIKHEDLVSEYDCQYNTDHTDYFEWICQMYVHISLNGFRQLTYWYNVKSKLNKKVEDSVVVDITQNEIQGDCCDNTLEVQSELRICTDSSCGSYHDKNSLTPFSVPRLTPITVEHIITTPEFAGDYYVNVKEFYLGFYKYEQSDLQLYQPFLGKTRITFIPNLASSGQIIKSIAELKQTAPIGLGDNRRLLQQGGDQRFKGETAIVFEQDEVETIEYKEQKLYESDDELENAQQETQKSLMGLIFMAGIIGTFCLCIIVAGSLYCKFMLKEIKQFDVKSNSVEQASQMQSSRASSTRSINVQQQQ